MQEIPGNLNFMRASAGRIFLNFDQYAQRHCNHLLGLLNPGGRSGRGYHGNVREMQQGMKR